jgi:hypothetical protein
MSEFIGSGDLYIARYEDGVLMGELEVGDADSFVINAPKVEKKELKSKQRADYGRVIASVVIGITQDVKFTLMDINRENLRLALFGADAAETQAEGSVTGEVLKTWQDRWAKLAKRSIKTTPAPTVTATDQSATFAENTDYVLDTETGRVKTLSTGDIDDGANVYVNYSHTALSGGFRVRANTETQTDVFIRLVGTNLNTKKPFEVVIWKLTLEPSASLEWLTNDFAKLELSGQIISTPNGMWDYLEPGV